ncbi:MAG TPA: transglutaminase domain-containing protein [Woeseiaceae bacterium]|nr:transglutaminase domain-containing protein [Woeseiaceae bacterium]
MRGSCTDAGRCRAKGAIVALALVSLAPPVSAEGVGLYLWELGKQSVSGADRLADETVAVVLEVRDPQEVASRIGSAATLDVIAIDLSSITVRSRSTDSIRGGPGAATSASSFIIDYEEPAISDLLAGWQRTSAAPLTPEELRAFVYGHVAEKTYLRGYDVASRVAETGSGDCTEHAFLLAALARAEGYPARVVLGILLHAAGDEVQAFGHAWTEIHDGTDWQRHDATLPAESMPGEWLRYLPLMPVVNEGISYQMGLFEIATLWPSAVRVVPGAGGP